MGKFDDALYNAANADDTGLGTYMDLNKRQHTSDRRVSAVRATILRFLEGVDEDVTVLELRQDLE